MLTDEQLGSSLRHQLTELGSEIHPSPELTQRLLDHAPSRRPPRRVRTPRRLPVLGLALAALAAAIVVITSSGTPSIVARAYAATDPAGVIVHYVETLTFSGGGSRAKTTVREVWRSGQRLHVIQAPNNPRAVDDIAIDGRDVHNYTQNTIAIYKLPATFGRGSCTPGQVLAQLCNNNAQADPVAALRRLAHDGRLHSAGPTTLDGHRVDRLTGTTDGYTITAFVDPYTFLPIKIQATEPIPRPRIFGPPQYLTTTVTNYQQLTTSPQNAELLLLRPHPGARIVHPPGRDSQQSQQH
jgi:hypothetical protein